MARSLIANEQGGTLAQLKVDPRQPLQHRILGAIVVHTTAVFLCRQRLDMLQPFVHMLNSPATLVVSRTKVPMHHIAAVWNFNFVSRSIYSVHQVPLLLQNAYLPTMPEDHLPEAKRVLGGRFYGMYIFLDCCLFIRIFFIFYFRVSKRSCLPSGRCKCVPIFCFKVPLWCGILQCGRPRVEGTCNICGAAIGGVAYRLRHDNRDARR